MKKELEKLLVALISYCESDTEADNYASWIVKAIQDILKKDNG